MKIHVLSTYQYNYFGERKVTSYDADDFCETLSDLCQLFYYFDMTKSNYIHLSILFNIIII